MGIDEKRKGKRKEMIVEGGNSPERGSRKEEGETEANTYNFFRGKENILIKNFRMCGKESRKIRNTLKKKKKGQLSAINLIKITT